MRHGDLSRYTLTGVGMTELVGASEHRVRLYISVDTGVAFVVDRPGLPDGSGIPITPSSPLTLDRATFGDMLHHSWHASVLAGSVRVGVLDVQQSGDTDQSYTRVS